MSEITRRETILQTLEKEFSALDTVLIRSIANDFDPLKQLQELRSTLESLTSATLYDDDEDFDPSGTGGYGLPGPEMQHGEHSTQSESKEGDHGINVSSSSNNQSLSDMTGLENSLHQLSMDDDNRDTEDFDEAMNDMEALSLKDKVAYLQEMFVSRTMETVEKVFRENGDNFKKALDILLNMEYIVDAKIEKKGIDGFWSDDSSDYKDSGNGNQRSKKKSRKRNDRRNKRDSSKYDSDKLNRMLETTGGISAPFSTAHPKSPTTTQHDQTIIPQYRPLSLNDEAGDWKVVARRRSHTPSPPSTPTVSYASASRTPASALPNHSRKYAGAIVAAHAADNRAKIAAYQYTIAAEADEIVRRRETSKQIDLHGVNQENGKRIALQKTNKWYDGLGDMQWLPAGRRILAEGFTIICGKGLHSVNQRGVLGTAVFKTLILNGWKVESEGGVVRVTGRKRR